MSASNGTNGYLNDWRNSFSLVRKNGNCKNGQTFRGAHPSVQMPINSAELANPGSTCLATAAAAAGRGAGTAKPGPTTDTSSRIARLKQLQTRTRTNLTPADTQNKYGTDRGAHAHVENASWGAGPSGRRAQLFGNYGELVPGQTSGRGGDSSQVTYFKNVFDRTSLNQPGPVAGNN